MIANPLHDLTQERTLPHRRFVRPLGKLHMEPFGRTADHLLNILLQGGKELRRGETEDDAAGDADRGRGNTLGALNTRHRAAGGQANKARKIDLGETPLAAMCPDIGK